MDFQSLLPQLTLEEKVSLLSGQNFTSTGGIKRLGIPQIKVADGINGVRPSQHESEMSTACFPNTTCLASTWDAELLEELGERLAKQARMKSAQVVLGPTINIHRDPRGGRNFECFSEDPLLSGQLAGAISNGLQKNGVGSCPKHFVCNDSELWRHYYDVQESVNGRVLREIYLAAWQHLLRVADPVGIMMALTLQSYNKVEGKFCSDSHPLMQEILREQWGYKGITMSDWFGTHATEGPIKAGLDLEMPFPVNRARKLVAAVKSGDISESEIDVRVAKMLELRDRTRDCHQDEPERSDVDEATSQTARNLAAGGIILLKNANEALPLNVSRSSKVAVIGEYAKDPVVTGGGSASCVPQYKVSHLDALREAAPENIIFEYTTGVRSRRVIPLAPTEILKTLDGHDGIEVNYFNEQSGEPILTEHRGKPQVWMLGEFPKGLDVPGSRIELTTKLTPTTSGKHTLAVRTTGDFALTVNGTEVLSGKKKEVSTEQFIFNHILLESRHDITMEADQAYDLRLVMKSPEKLTAGEPTPYAASICFEEFRSEDRDIENAVELARISDTSIIFAGRNGQYESEGYDLEEIRMPINQTKLIRAVAAASKRTILVLHCGNPIDISELVDDVDAVLNAHFPGQEGSRALADILTGKVSPSGRLATTWFKTLEDTPSFGHFPAKKLSDGTVVMKYAEGLQMGYRHPELERVRWPFGHGLSYTTFNYSDLSSKTEAGSSNQTLVCSVTVTNAGGVAGHEVVQLYVTPSDSTIVWRPAKELKAFKKIFLQPGESKTISLGSDLEVACSYWDEQEVAWRMDAGTYGVLEVEVRDDI
ncbi:hypothetical protein TruAng_003872 [Truncatella angustata]|nr:hypothetical protein TruAng_003872 [Truncatella angustata]